MSEIKPKCAVRNCDAATSAIGKLCGRHPVPGVVVESPSRTYVITSWYAEHGGTRGIVLLNDFALGDLFGGLEAFRAEMMRQGLTAIRLLATPEEVEDAKRACRLERSVEHAVLVGTVNLAIVTREHVWRFRQGIEFKYFVCQQLTDCDRVSVVN